MIGAPTGSPYLAAPAAVATRRAEAAGITAGPPRYGANDSRRPRVTPSRRRHHRHDAEPGFRAHRLRTRSPAAECSVAVSMAAAVRPYPCAPDNAIRARWEAWRPHPVTAAATASARRSAA